MTASGEVVLRKTMEENFEKIDDMNQKRIELRCGEVQRQIEVCIHYAITIMVLL